MNQLWKDRWKTYRRRRQPVDTILASRTIKWVWCHYSSCSYHRNHDARVGKPVAPVDRR